MPVRLDWANSRRSLVIRGLAVIPGTRAEARVYRRNVSSTFRAAARSTISCLVSNVDDGAQTRLTLLGTPLYQERSSRPRSATSGLPLTTDIIRSARHVSKVPKHKVAALQPAAREQEPRGR